MYYICRNSLAPPTTRDVLLAHQNEIDLGSLETIYDNNSNTKNDCPVFAVQFDV